MQLVGGRLDPHLQPEPVGDLAQPDAVVLVAADEAEVVLAQPEHGGVVDHAAGLVAQRRVDHLADGQLADVAGDHPLHQRLGVGAQHLPLAQRREVHDGQLLAAGPVLGDGALVVEAVRQPVAAVLDEALGQRRGAAGETRSPGSAPARRRRSRAARWPSRSGSRANRRARGHLSPPRHSMDRCRRGRPTTRTPGRSSPAASRSRPAATTARRTRAACCSQSPCCRRS